MADDKEVEKTVAEDLVVTKYKLAGQIVNRKLETCVCINFISKIVQVHYPFDLMTRTRVIAMRTVWCRFYILTLECCLTFITLCKSRQFSHLQVF